MLLRIMIFGRPGSGKSTFALELHKSTGIPLHHLDKYFFVEDWVKRDYSEFLSIQQSIVDKSDWIVDGNSVRSLEVRYARADVCLYFNLPRLKCLWRILKRRFKKGNLEIDDRAPGCNERVTYKLIKYMLGFQNRVTPILYLRTKYPEVKFIEVNSDKDLVSFKKVIGRV